MKRRAPTDASAPISPPSVKRKVESTTTNKAVTSFFKPTSQKDPETLVWKISHQTLITGNHRPATSEPQELSKPVKIAVFDLDDTVIAPLGAKFVRSPSSWKWFDTTVPGRLKTLYEQGYLVAILSNQGSINLKDNPKSLQKDSLSLANFKGQISTVFRHLQFPVNIYAATNQDQFRKPRTGMWQALLADYGLDGDDNVDLGESFYVGDAAGRVATEKRKEDWACSDRDLAANIGIRFYTPEQFFLNAEDVPFKRRFDPKEYLEAARSGSGSADEINFKKLGKQEIVITCGSPASGKSSFYWNVLQPQGYERANQDLTKTRDKCLKLAREYLSAGLSVAVDNTNANIETRAYWVRLAKEFNIPIRCVRFTASPELCEHNDCVRALSDKSMNPETRTLLPTIAFRGYKQRFEEPRLAEGFQDITIVDFKLQGTPEQVANWSKYWVSKYS